MRKIVKLLLLIFSIVGLVLLFLLLLHYSNNEGQINKYYINCSKLKVGMQLNDARVQLGEFDEIGFVFYKYKPDFTILSLDSKTFRCFLEYPMNDVQDGGVVLEFDPQTNKIIEYRCCNPQ